MMAMRSAKASVTLETMMMLISGHESVAFLDALILYAKLNGMQVVYMRSSLFFFSKLV